MARMAAYLGPATRVAQVFEPGPLALFGEGHASDGFGLGWYPGDGDPEPVTLCSRLPPAREEGQLRLARRLASSCILGGLRKLAPGESDELTGTQPFQLGPYLFAFDGEIARFREVFERPMRARLGALGYSLLRGSAPAELLFATWADALGEQRSPEAVAGALEKMVDVVREAAGSTEAHATLGVVVADGSSLVTLRTAANGTPPSMYTIVADESAPVPATGRVIASEPTFPGSWSSIDPHSLIIFTAD